MPGVNGLHQECDRKGTGVQPHPSHVPELVRCPESTCTRDRALLADTMAAKLFKDNKLIKEAGFKAN